MRYPGKEQQSLQRTHNRRVMIAGSAARSGRSGVRVRIVVLRARDFFLSADARIGNASNRRKGLTQVVRETRIYQGISEPARNVTGFLADLLRMCQV